MIRSIFHLSLSLLAVSFVAGCASDSSAVPTPTTNMTFATVVVPITDSSIRSLEIVLQPRDLIVAKVPANQKQTATKYTTSFASALQNVAGFGRVPVFEFKNIASGAYHLSLRAIGATTVMYTSEFNFEVDSRTTTLSMNTALGSGGINFFVAPVDQATGTIVVRTTVPIQAQNLRFTAQVSDSSTDLRLVGGVFVGTLGDVTTGLSTVLVVEGRDDSNNLKYQGSKVINVDENSQEQVVQVERVIDTAMPYANQITNWSIPDKASIEAEVQIELSLTNSSNQAIGELLLAWGDGTSHRQTLLTGNALVKLSHRYTGSGVRVATACLISPTMGTQCSSRYINVVSANGSATADRNSILQLKLTKLPLYASNVAMEFTPQQTNAGRGEGTVPIRRLALSRETTGGWFGTIRLRRGVRYALKPSVFLGELTFGESSIETEPVTLQNQVTSLEFTAKTAAIDLSKLPESNLLLPGVSELRTARLTYKIDTTDFPQGGRISTDATRLDAFAQREAEPSTKSILSTIDVNAPRFVTLESATGQLLAMDFVAAFKPFIAFNHYQTAITLVLSEIYLPQKKLFLDESALLAIINHLEFRSVVESITRSRGGYPDEQTRLIIREIAKSVQAKMKMLGANELTPNRNSPLSVTAQRSGGKAQPLKGDLLMQRARTVPPSKNKTTLERVLQEFPPQTAFISQAQITQISKSRYALNSRTAFGFDVFQKSGTSFIEKVAEVGSSNNVIGLNIADFTLNYFLSRTEFQVKDVPDDYCGKQKIALSMFFEPNSVTLSKNGAYNLAVTIDSAMGLIGTLLDIPVQRLNAAGLIGMSRPQVIQKISKMVSSIALLSQTAANLNGSVDFSKPVEVARFTASLSDVFKSLFAVVSDMAAFVGEDFNLGKILQLALEGSAAEILARRVMASNPVAIALKVESLSTGLYTVINGIMTLVREFQNDPVAAIVQREPEFGLDAATMKLDVAVGSRKSKKFKVLNKGCGQLTYSASFVGEHEGIDVYPLRGTVQGAEEGDRRTVDQELEFTAHCPENAGGATLKGELKFSHNGLDESGYTPGSIPYEVRCIGVKDPDPRFYANVEVTSPVQIIAEADINSSDPNCSTTPVTMQMRYAVPDAAEVETEQALIPGGFGGQDTVSMSFEDRGFGERVAKFSTRLNVGVYSALLKVKFKGQEKLLSRSWSFRVRGVGGCPPKRPPCTVCGDPHIVTPDGLAFDSHAFGEFWYLRPQPGKDPNGLALQGRQEGISTQFAPSVMTGLAARIDGRIIEFSRSGRTRVDGVLQPNNTFSQLSPNVTLGINNNESVLTWKTGSLTYSATSLFLSVQQDDTLHGLLGSPNGDASDDYRLPNGTVPVDNLKLGFALSDGWRVRSKSESLFTYEAGQGPETFNKPNNRGLPSLEEIARARVDVDRLFRNACGDGDIPTVTADGIALDTLLGMDETNSLAQMCAYEVKGKLANSTLPGVPLAGARVRVSSSVFQPCDTFTDAFGNYRCLSYPSATAGQVTGASAVTVAVDGAPPVNLPLSGKAAKGQTVSINQDLAAPLTTLRLSGQLLDEAGLPVTDTRVSLGGEGQYRAATTDSDGRYQFFVPFPRALSTDFFMTLTAGRSGARAERVFGTRLVVDGLKDQTENLRFERIVRFSGALRLEGGRSLDGNVTVLGANGSELCRARVDAGRYTCNADVPQGASFAVSYAASGAWGNVENLGIAQVQADGTEIAQDLTVGLGSVSRLRVTGRVLRSTDAAISNASVSLTGDSLLGDATVRTDDDGRYTAVLLLNRTTATGRINLLAQARGLSVPGVVSFAGAEVGTLVEVNADDLRLRRVISLQGSLRTALDASGLGLPLGGSVLVKRDGTTLCNVTAAGGAFRCEVTVDDDTPFTLTLAATGDWGSASATLEVPGGDTGVALPPTLIAQGVRVLTVRGAVRDTVGDPVPGARVEVLGDPQISNVAIPVTNADQNGAFMLAFVLKSNATDGRLRLRATVTERSGEAGPLAYRVDGANLLLEAGNLVVTRTPLSARLQLKGIVEDAAGRPVEGATVSASSSVFAQVTSGVTTSDGSYTAEAIVRPGLTAGEIVLRTGGSANDATTRLNFTDAIPGDTLIVPVPTLRFLRTVTFSGAVSNATVPRLPVNTRIVVYAGETLLCDSGVGWSIVENNAVGQYSCTAVLATAAAFNASVNTVGAWGASSVTVSVPAAPAGRATTAVSQNLVTAPTVLRVAGRVLDASTTASVSTGVRLSSSGLENNTLALITNARGEYEGYGIVLPGNPTVELGFVVRDNGNNVSTRSRSQAVVSNTLIELNENFTLENRLPGLARWTATAGSSAPPTVAPSGALYVGSAQGLQAFDPDGAPRWTFAAARTTAALADSGVIYVGGDRLYALNPDGTQRWSFGAGSNVGPAAVAGDGTVLAATSGGEVIAVNPDGGLRWRRSLARVSLEAAPVVLDTRRIYVKVGSDTVQSLSFAGALEWSRTFPVGISSPAPGSDGTLYFVQTNATITALNPDGSQKWNVQAGSFAATNPPVVTGGLVYVALGSKLLALRSDGSEQWVYDLPTQASTPLVADDGSVYVAAGVQLHAVNPSGVRRWIYSSGSVALGAPGIGVDGTLYVPSATALFAVNSESAGLASGWAKIAGNAASQSRASSDGTARRTVVFAGSLLPTLLARNYRVEVSNTVGEVLCRAVVANSGEYACGSQTEQLSGFDVNVRATGPFGSASAVLSVSPGAQDTEQMLRQDLSPRRVLAVRGTVKGPTGTALRSAAVIYRSPVPFARFDGTSLTELQANTNYSLITDNTGVFNLTLLYPLESADARVEFSTRDPFGNPGNAQIETALVANNVTTAEANLVVDNTLSGSVRWFDQYSDALGVSVGTDGTVYKPRQSLLRALRSDGTKLWDYFAPSNIAVPAVVGDSMIYLGLVSGQVVALRANGTVAWVTASGLPQITALALSPLAGVLARSPSTMVALDTAGLIQWTVAIRGQTDHGAIYVRPDGIADLQSTFVSPAGDESGYAFTCGNSYTPCRGMMFAEDGNRYGFAGTALRRADAQNNISLVYDTDPQRGLYSSYIRLAAFAADNRFALALENGTVVSIGRNGSERWRNALGGDGVIELAAGSDGMVYALTTSNAIPPLTRVYALDADGQSRVLFERSGITARSINLRGGLLYITATSDNQSQAGVYAVNVSSPALNGDGWSESAVDNTRRRATLGDGIDRRTVRYSGTLRINGVITPNRSVVAQEGRFGCYTSTDVQGRYQCGVWTPSVSSFEAKFYVYQPRTENGSSYSAPEFVNATVVPAALANTVTTFAQDINAVTTDLTATIEAGERTMSYDTLETRTVTVRNIGGGTASNIRVFGTLDGFSARSITSSTAGITCSDVSLECTVASLDSGASLTFTLRGEPIFGRSSGTMGVRLSSSTFDVNSNNQNLVVTYTFIDNSPPTDLMVDLPGPGFDSDETRFVRTLRVGNISSSVARDVIVLVQPATGVSVEAPTNLVASTRFLGFGANGSFRVSIASINPGEAYELLVPIRAATSVSTVEVQASVTTRTPEPDTSNNTVTRVYPRVPTTDLYVRRIDAVPISSDELTSVAVTLANRSAVAAQNVRVRFDLSGMIERSIVPPAGSTCGSWTGDTVECTISQIGTERPVWALRVRGNATLGNGRITVTAQSDTAERSSDDLVKVQDYLFVQTLEPVDLSLEPLPEQILATDEIRTVPVRLSNLSTTNAAQIRVRFETTNLLEVSVQEPVGASCGVWDGSALECTLSSLAGGDSIDWALSVRGVPDAVQGRIEVTASSANIELTPSDLNRIRDYSISNPVPDIVPSITQFNSEVNLRGWNGVYLQLTNAGRATARSVRVNITAADFSGLRVNPVDSLPENARCRNLDATTIECTVDAVEAGGDVYLWALQVKPRTRSTAGTVRVTVSGVAGEVETINNYTAATYTVVDDVFLSIAASIVDLPSMQAGGFIYRLQESAYAGGYVEWLGTEARTIPVTVRLTRIDGSVLSESTDSREFTPGENVYFVDYTWVASPERACVVLIVDNQAYPPVCEEP